jgi:hypothetical protein
VSVLFVHMWWARDSLWTRILATLLCLVCWLVVGKPPTLQSHLISPPTDSASASKYNTRTRLNVNVWGKKERKETAPFSPKGQIPFAASTRGSSQDQLKEVCHGWPQSTHHENCCPLCVFKSLKTHLIIISELVLSSQQAGRKEALQ